MEGKRREGPLFLLHQPTISTSSNIVLSFSNIHLEVHVKDERMWIHSRGKSEDNATYFMQ